jgi:hypothetical protein
LNPYELPSVEHDDAQSMTKVLPALVDLWIVLVWFVGAAAIGALVWWQVTPLAEYTRTAQNGSMDEQQLAVQIAADGWFFVVAAVGGLVSGFVLILLRHRNPIVTVIGIAAGGVLAYFLMREIGLVLGPPDPTDALRTASVGDKVPLQLKPVSDGLLYVWSVAALAGALVALLITELRHANRAHNESMRQYVYGGQYPVQGSAPGPVQHPGWPYQPSSPGPESQPGGIGGNG